MHRDRNPLNWALVIALVGALCHLGWASKTPVAGSTPSRGRAWPTRAQSPVSTSVRWPSSTSSPAPRTNRARPVTPAPERDVQEGAVANGIDIDIQIRNRTENSEPEFTEQDEEIGDFKVVEREPMGRTWLSLDDDLDGEREQDQGLLGRLSTYVRGYTMREGLGSLSDEDIACLVQVHRAQREGGSHISIVQPLALFARLLLRTSPACKFRLLAKSRMFAHVDFVKGLLEVMWYTPPVSSRTN